MNIQLTEKMIRERASEQSFSKGRDYFSGGTIYDPSWQSIPGGVALMARCEGSSAPSYLYDEIEMALPAVQLISQRPDWVIRVALKQANELIVQTQSKLYPAAAEWLECARKAYLHKDQADEWQAYIANLRATYARQPALQKAISHL